MPERSAALPLAAAPDAVGLSAPRLEAFGARIAADAEAGRIPGAVVLVARRGQIAWQQAFGFEDGDSRTRPMRIDSVFRLAAMTRPMVAVVAMRMLEQGRLALTDPIERYLPAFARMSVGVETTDASGGERRLTLEPARRAITVQDLLRHTAGFTYGPFGDSLVQRLYREHALLDARQSNEQMVARLATLPLQCQPGTQFEYGMSTDVLGRILEVVAGADLEQVVADELTRPLGLHATGFGLRGGADASLALPRRGSGAPGGVLFDYDPVDPPRWFSGGAGLLSTASDYATFCQMLLAGGTHAGMRLLSGKSVALMLANHLPPGIDYGSSTPGLGINAPVPALGQGHGLGVGVRLDAGLCPVPGSAGDFFWGGALGTYFWADPSEELIAILMLQEKDIAVRTGYRTLLRNVVYGALLD